MQEYRMTLMTRIIATLTLPLFAGLLFTISTFSNGVNDMLGMYSGIVLKLAAACCIAYLIYIWLSHSSKRFYLNKGELVEQSMFGRKAVRLDASTSVIADSVDIFAKARGLGADVIKGSLAIVQSLTNVKESTIRHIYVWVSDGQTQIKLNNNVRNIMELRSKMWEFEDTVILPKLKEKLQSKNGVVAFGKCVLSSREFKYGKKSIPIKEISEIIVHPKNRTFIFKRKGQFLAAMKIEIKSIPNSRSMMTLIEELHAVSGSQ